MSKALLICNGEKPGRWLKKIAQEADFILAADGGANAAVAIGVRPDAVIGDLDSLSPHTRHLLKDTPILKINRQDNTDLEKALDWLTTQHFQSCTIVGATGGRIDFTVGNILAVQPYVKKINLSFQDKDWALYPVYNTLSLSVRTGCRISLIALSKCTNVTLTGCKYTLSQEELTPKHIGRSLSNQASAPTISVSLSTGLLLVYVEK